MSSIYIHIPFCKQACHYCDFYFSTSLKKKEVMVNALCRELELRRDALPEKVETIYFGGGTPSLLTLDEIHQVLETLFSHYVVIDTAEITLEANPDDLSVEKLKQLSQSPINRLSIGVQSFFEDDLGLMNRAHHAEEAWNSVVAAKRYFQNITIDLIYGIPGMENAKWKANLQKAFRLEIPHLSCYALTVEPKTALKAFIEKGLISPVSDEVAKEHHKILIQETQKRGFVNYEFSNFGKPGFESQNNLAYWLGKPYLGIGPSAHSYDGSSRSWNVANNSKYIQAIEAGILPLERETLSVTDRYNEYVMTRLRTLWGVSLEALEQDFGVPYKEYLLAQAQRHLKEGLLYLDDHAIKVSPKGKFLSDGIASDLFLLHLNGKHEDFENDHKL